VWDMPRSRGKRYSESPRKLLLNNLEADERGRIFDRGGNEQVCRAFDRVDVSVGVIEVIHPTASRTDFVNWCSIQRGPRVVRVPELDDGITTSDRAIDGGTIAVEQLESDARGCALMLNRSTEDFPNYFGLHLIFSPTTDGSTCLPCVELARPDCIHVRGRRGELVVTLPNFGDGASRCGEGTSILGKLHRDSRDIGFQRATTVLHGENDGSGNSLFHELSKNDGCDEGGCKDSPAKDANIVNGRPVL